MLKSMTAFGRARGLSASGTKDITAELKSVNSRFLDCSVRLPRTYSFLEEKVKAYLTQRGIVRGKIEVYIGVDILAQDGTKITLDRELTASYLDALRALRDEFGLTDDISVMSVAANRDLFLVKKAEDDLEKDWEDVRTVLGQAIDTFLAAREREGENLRRDILTKAEKIMACTARVKELSEGDISGYRDKLEDLSLYHISREFIEDLMNKKSGFLGVTSGYSSDSRDLQKAISEGPSNPHHEQSKLAIDILKLQLKKFIGAYAAEMNGLDAVVFTAGIGENSTTLREAVLTDLDFLGIDIDKDLNAKITRQSDNVKISTEKSKVAVYVIPTNEELLIARDTAAIVSAI